MLIYGNKLISIGYKIYYSPIIRAVNQKVDGYGKLSFIPFKNK